MGATSPSADPLTAIPAINRGQIINDAWSLAKAGQLDMSIALQTFNFLKNDDDYVPWRAMARELSYLDLMLTYTPAYGMFKTYMVDLVNSTYESLFGNRTTLEAEDPNTGESLYNATKNGEAPIDIFQRERIMSYACQYGLEKCQDLATSEFDRWKNDQSYSIDVNLRSIVYCNGIRYGSDADWQHVLDRFKMEESTAEKGNLRSALSCTREPYLLRKLMELARDRSQNVIEAQDTRSVLEAVSANPYGRDMAVTFLKLHFHELTNYMTPGSFGTMVRNLMQHFNEQYQLDEVGRFMTDTDVTVAESSFRQVLENSQVNMAWMDDYYNTISTFLNQNS